MDMRTQLSRRRGLVLVSGAALLVLANVAAAVIVLQGRSGTSAAIAVPSARSLGGGGLTADGSTYLAAARSGDLLIGLGAHAGGSVDVVAILASEKPFSESAIRLARGSRTPTAPASSCGSNCFRFKTRVLAGRAVTLTISVNGRRVARFPVPPRLPPAASGLLARTNRAMGRVRSLRVRETLSSGLSSLRSTFEMSAPDRLAYVTSAGDRAIVIGGRRWDRTGTGRWERSETTPLRMPSYMWAGAAYARLLGTARVGRARVHVLGAFRPSARYPAWFRLLVQPNGRVLEAQMLATGHFMVDRYSSFDAPLRIRPPD